MNVTKLTDSDEIYKLPTVKTPPTENELHLVNTLFKEHRNTMSTIFDEAKESILIGSLFVLFNLKQIDNILQRFIPITITSPYILVLIKSLFIMLIYWVIKYFYLSRK